MNQQREILVVAPTPSLARNLASWLRKLGDRPTIVSTFAAAKDQLQKSFDLVITELKLGAYNGLHLALKGRTSGIPCIVVGRDDFEADAEQLGAVYVSADALDAEHVGLMVDRLVQTRHIPLWQQDVVPASPAIEDEPDIWQRLRH
jgi:CheY-like chemotaxis protein